MTYGALRLRLSKLAAGVDLELIDGWIQDRYTAILDQLPWKRLEGETTIQVPPSVTAGTITATQGVAAVQGVGTAWTAAQTGLTMRINCSEEFYIFTQVDATDGVLDRPFEQPTVTGAPYRIDQNVFLCALGARVVRAVRGFHPERPIHLITPGELNRMAPDRKVYGYPRWAAATWDSNTDPPILQIELYPIPDSPDSIGSTPAFAVDYIYDAGDLDPSQTGFSMLPWVRPAALINGVLADVAAWKEKLNQSMAYETKFAALVKQMAMINALQRGPTPIRLARELRGGVRGPDYHWAKHADRDYFGDFYE
jgi:hypothetical protein